MRRVVHVLRATVSADTLEYPPPALPWWGQAWRFALVAVLGGFSWWVLWVQYPAVMSGGDTYAAGATVQTAGPAPTGYPTDLPTDLPSGYPTDLPTDLPSDVPTDLPTDVSGPMIDASQQAVPDLGWQLSMAVDHPWLRWVDLALGLGMIGLLFYRRRAPVLVGLVGAVLSVISVAGGFAASLAMCSVATRRRVREIAVVFGAALTATYLGQTSILLSATAMPGAPWLTALFAAIGLGFLILLGLYVGARREIIERLRDRAETAEREQLMRVAQARIAERARIAREMHDVLAHRISTVAMHAGVLAFRSDLSRDQVRSAVDIINDGSRKALTELRDVLGVLREIDDDAGQVASLVAAPAAPSAPQISGLIADAAATGQRVLAQVDVDLGSIPRATGESLYRMVQECLTNARKHAPQSRVLVRLHGDAEAGITLRVSNPLSRASGLPGARLGLMGLAERAELAGGWLRHSVDPAGFQVEAWLPWQPPEADSTDVVRDSLEGSGVS